MTVAPFAFEPNGAVMVLGDGPELLVYQGDNDSPRWKVFTDGIIVGVGATADRVIGADADGKIIFWRIFDGQQLDEVRLGVPVDGLAITADGLCAAITADSVILAGMRREPVPLPAPGASAVAFGPEGSSLGVGTSHGHFSAIDPTTGMAWGTVELGLPVRGVAWSALGQWVVAAGQSVFLISGDGTEVVDTFDQIGEPSQISCSADGAFFAVLLGGAEVAIFERQYKKRIGSIEFSEDIGGLQFGPGFFLGIGMENGDANRIDLMTGKYTRTELHAGRGMNKWGIKVKIEAESVRGTAAWARVGGTPLAERVKHKWEEKRAPGEIGPPGGDMPSCTSMLGVGCALLLVIVVCGGCCGGGYYWYYGGLGPLGGYLPF